ncbi:MAG: DUF2934 domain-containing protein [Gammaproteobacteria bacterium]|nr:DUF2934 domain-containing protein [Gammaproteobacteria bacterium]
MTTATATTSTKKPRSKKASVMTELNINTLTQEERQQMIAETAYYIAEQHGFEPGRDQQNWLEAERQVDQMLSQHITENNA